jgi:hypothetical protein
MPSPVCATTLLLPSAIITSYRCSSQFSSCSQLVEGTPGNHLTSWPTARGAPSTAKTPLFTATSFRRTYCPRSLAAWTTYGPGKSCVSHACFNSSCVTAATATWLFASWTISVMAAYLDILWSPRTATLTTTLWTTRKSVLVLKQGASCAKYCDPSSLPTRRTSAVVSSSSTSWKLLLPPARS